MRLTRLGSCSEGDMKNKKFGMMQEMKNNDLTREQLLDKISNLQDKIIILQKTVATQRKTEDANIQWEKQSAYQLSVHDTTGRKQTEALTMSEEKFRSIMENSADAIFITDQKGKYLYTNKAVTIMLGFSSEEMKKKLITDLAPKDRINEYMEIFSRLLTHGKVFTEIELMKKDGGFIPTDLNSIMLPGGLIYGSCRDISERKKAELELIGAKDKAEESDRLKTAFLHNISHEIRTPLNAIVGFSALLGEPGETEETRKSFTEIIRGSSDYLLDIVSGIIEISNIEAGILKLNLNEINLNGIMKNLHEQFRAKTDEKGIGLSYETLLSDNNAYIQADNTKLIQILSNLLNNAIKFTNTGQIEFGYNVRNGYLEFYVSDTGIGIQHDQSERIFDRFYQVDYSVSRLYEGTGLGLSISKSYVEFLGGKIWLSSRPGSGTVFYFTIPYLKTVKPFIKDWKGSGTEKIILNEQKTVLIAEDEESNCLLMKEQLSSLHVDILYANNGKEAVEMCAADKKIDLVLMDIKMPVMNGFEATKKIRNFRPELPIIATTAYAFETDREEALNIGCSDYISKPVGKNALLEMVNKYLY